jgi:PAS domain S-box-containing protein
MRESSPPLPPERLRSLILHAVEDAVFTTDLDNRVTFWADSAARMFGYPAADAVGHLFGELLPFEMAAGDEADLLAAVAHGQVWRGEGSIRLPDGRRLWIESTVRPLVIEGRIIGSVSISRDRTAAHAAERALWSLSEPAGRFGGDPAATPEAPRRTVRRPVALGGRQRPAPAGQLDQERRARMRRHRVGQSAEQIDVQRGWQQLPHRGLRRAVDDAGPKRRIGSRLASTARAASSTSWAMSGGVKPRVRRAAFCQSIGSASGRRASGRCRILDIRRARARLTACSDRCG